MSPAYSLLRYQVIQRQYVQQFASFTMRFLDTSPAITKGQFVFCALQNDVQFLGLRPICLGMFLQVKLISTTSTQIIAQSFLTMLHANALQLKSTT
jgi:hypothetical protein